jgi:hypothetical protein
MGVYIHGHSDVVLRAHRSRTAANSASHLLPLLEPGMSLLDDFAGEVRALLASHSADGIFWDWPGDTEVIMARKPG